MKHLRYDLDGTPIEDKRHAQTVMRDLGIVYQHATPQSVSASWIFWNCESIPAILPEYIRELETDPRNWIGYGLTTEQAESIIAKTTPAVNTETHCPDCKQPWDDHEFGVPSPSCPAKTTP